MNTFFRRILASAVFCLLSGALSAQTSTATLKVRVTDPSGGVVANAELRLSGTAQNIRHQGLTDGAGRYTFTFLDPGLYSLDVIATGFASFTQSNVVLQVGQNAEMDIALKVGGVSESVVVQAGAVQLDTATGALGSVVDRQAMDDLPLNGRSAYQLGQLNSTVTSTASSRSGLPTLTGATAYAISGSRSQTNEVLMDGSPITGRADNYVEITPSTDSVQEFRVQSNSYSAEYGRVAGGTINLVTRSGGNHFHGTLWEFLRNDTLDANTFFANRQGAGKGKLRYNQFGANLGGPIIKDRLFFFSNFEMLRSVSGPLVQSTVPTARMKSGDFGELTGGIYAVSSSGERTLLERNQIPVTLQNPVGKKLLSYLPDPNRPGLLNNFVAFNPIDSTNRQIVERIDYQMSVRQRIFFRLTRDWDLTSTGGNFPGSVATTTQDGSTIAHPVALTLDYVNTLTPRAILHLSASFSRSTQVRTQASAGFDPTTLGFPSYIATASGEGRVFPTIAATGYMTMGPLKNFGETDTYQNNLAWAGDVTMLRGAHVLKFGANFRVYQLNNFRANDPAGNFTFTRSFTARTATDTTTGDSIASMLMGLPAAGDIGIAPKLAAQNKYFAGFLQDDWTVSSKLTLNLGVRWETDLPTTERFNRMTNFSSTAAFPVNLTLNFPAALNLPGRSGPLTGGLLFVGREGNSSRYLSTPDVYNFAPRLGLAYKLSPKTVVRAGGGIFYATMSGGGISAGVLGMLTETIETAYVASLDNGVTPAPGATLSNPFPSGISPVPGTSQGALTGYGVANVQSRLRDLRDPYNAQWNFNIQRELPGKMLMEIAYAGSAGVGLLGGNMDLNQISPQVRALGATVLNTTVANPFLALPANQQPPASSAIGRPTVGVAQLLRPYPQFGIVTALFQNSSHSTYHSVSARTERRFADLAFRASYTFSKVIDDISGISANNGTQIPDAQDANNRRLDKSLSTFDARHHFVGTLNYALPFGKGKRFLNHRGAGDLVFGGWVINSIINAQGGFPLSLSATPPAGQMGLSARTLRPNIVGRPAGTGATRDQQISAWFNTAALAQPASFQIGNAARTIPVRAPGYFGTDFAIHKNFAIKEDMRFQLRMEAFNLFNRVNLSPPGTVLGSASFGVISGTEAARQVQIAAKFYF